MDDDRVVSLNLGGLPYGRVGAHWALLDRGGVVLRRTIVDMDELIEGTTRRSGLPDVGAWLEAMVRTGAGDVEAIAAFGPRDGR